MATLPEALSNNNTDTDDLDGKFARLVEANRQWDLSAGAKLARRHHWLWKRYWKLAEQLDAVRAAPPEAEHSGVTFYFDEAPYRICPHGSRIPLWDHLLIPTDRRRCNTILTLRAAKELVIDRIIRTQELAKKRAQEIQGLHHRCHNLRELLAPRPRRRRRGRVSAS